MFCLSSQSKTHKWYNLKKKTLRPNSTNLWIQQSLVLNRFESISPFLCSFSFQTEEMNKAKLNMACKFNELELFVAAAALDQPAFAARAAV